MTLWHFFVIVNGVILLFSSCTSTAKLITDLPGQPDGVSFKQHSGFITTDSRLGHALFYYFVEADASDPLSHPLTLWLAGGPGCSSLGLGAFKEHGPFRPARDGHLMKNDFSWNKASNMLYVESPISVGFSYSNTTVDYADWKDADTARENMQFLLNWFREYPKYRDSDFYIAGVSYAGHYVPQFAALVVDHNKHSQGNPIKLRGIAVNNSLLHWIACSSVWQLFPFDFQAYYLTQKNLLFFLSMQLGNPLLDIQISPDSANFLWSHGVISGETFKLKKTVCNDSRYWTEMFHGKLSRECTKVSAKQAAEMGNFTDPLDVLGPYCISGTTAVPSAPRSSWDAYHAKLTSRMMLVDPCIDTYISSYLNNPRVQEALHVNMTKLPYVWDICSSPLSLRDTGVGDNIIPVLSALIKEHLRVLLFSGDQDSRIPLTQTRTIANLIARDLKFSSFGGYAPWYNGIQVGGWTESFGRSRKGKNATRLTFATVRGAAHEVPYTSPSQALTLFKAFLEGSSPPKVPFKN